MKYSLMLLIGLILLFSHANGQTPSNATPWDAAYKIPKEETRTIKGEKGKIIAITFWKMENYMGSIPQYALKLTKKEAQTGEKLEFTISIINTTDNRLLVLKENDELTIEARSSLLAYFSGYVYEVR